MAENPKTWKGDGTQRGSEPWVSIQGTREHGNKIIRNKGTKQKINKAVLSVICLFIYLFIYSFIHLFIYLYTENPGGALSDDTKKGCVGDLAVL